MAKVEAFRAANPEAARAEGPTHYPFYPQAGRIWDDIFPGSFFDVDPSPGISDYECTGYTYDSHQGIDTSIATWVRKDIGVPVYAALPGIVAAVADGNFDEQTDWNPNNKANYVIIDHGNTHQTWYWHLKNGSVAVEVGETVRAGQQIAMTASSGMSTGPHLHFESRFDGSPYDPFVGTCHPGESGFESQPSFRRDLFLREFIVTKEDLSSWSGPPDDTTREGYFGTGGQRVRFWAMAQNIPPFCPWRVRILRPDKSLSFDSGSNSFSNPTLYRQSFWYWSYLLDLSVTGTWTIELTLDGEVMAEAPFEVVGSPESGPNRPPLPPDDLAFSPTTATVADAIRCDAIAPWIVRDPDYDQLRYRFVWRVDGEIRRDVTIAAPSDMLPAFEAQSGQTVECAVTASDGLLESEARQISMTVQGIGLRGWMMF
ncbi:M23 family metallopeptidase [bacterium]|nr:M23 family metallopeptidase [bacterium]